MHSKCYIHGLLLQVTTQMLILLLMIIGATPVAAQRFTGGIAKEGCDPRCGDVEVPYPFGVTQECSLNDDFLITCTNVTTVTTTTTDGGGDDDDGGGSVISPSPGGYNYKALLVQSNMTIPVTNITTDGKLHIMEQIARKCYNKSGQLIPSEYANPTFGHLKRFRVSGSDNVFVTVGCDTYAWLRVQRPETGEVSWLGCMSFCTSLDSVPNGTCSGNGCCQTSFARGISRADMTLGSFSSHSQILDFDACSYAFIIDKDEFEFNSTYFESLRRTKSVPLVLDWAVGDDNCSATRQKQGATLCQANSTCVDLEEGPGYICKCLAGYEGNPYLPDGCRDRDECSNPAWNNCTFPRDQCRNTDGGFECICRGGKNGHPYCADSSRKSEILVIGTVSAVATLMLLALGILSFWAFTKWKLVKARESFFKKNGGHLLQQKLSQKDGSFTSTARIFSIDELVEATDGFSDKREIGRGGFGTVYKGTLRGGRTVAIKRSKVVDKNQVEQFINEVVVLSRIDHRNVVQLVGCCLETEVPLLVYEFVTNGTLSDHIHGKSKALHLTWEVRLRIAADTARVLSYLHNEASLQIIHRDIKSNNILLDDDYTAKVADFGCSRLVPADAKELTTMVQGTLGYLDPEYLQTSQLTDKSDVYSFGVLLAELLTAQPALSFDRPEEDTCLAMCFLSALKEDRLMQVVDDSVRDGNAEQVMEVARLAKGCLRLRGEERPTMKEVAVELEGLQITSERHPWAGNENNMEETVLHYFLRGTSQRKSHYLLDSLVELELWPSPQDGR